MITVWVWLRIYNLKVWEPKQSTNFWPHIQTLALCHEKKLTMITRFNGFLRVYDDIFLSRFEEYKLDAVPKKASLSSETFVYSYHIEEEEETDFVPNVTHILSIIKVRLQRYTYIHIKCSKQFNWNLYFYVSGQSRPFWAVLKLL